MIYIPHELEEKKISMEEIVMWSYFKEKDTHKKWDSYERTRKVLSLNLLCSIFEGCWSEFIIFVIKYYSLLLAT